MAGFNPNSMLASNEPNAVKWRRIHSASSRDTGHRIDRDDTGRISLCDWSAPISDRTDDGPLIVAPGSIVKITYVKRLGVVYLVPVAVERDGGRHGVVHTTTETMRALSALVPLKVELSAEFADLRDEVHFASGFSPAYG